MFAVVVRTLFVFTSVKGGPALDNTFSAARLRFFRKEKVGLRVFAGGGVGRVSGGDDGGVDRSPSSSSSRTSDENTVEFRRADGLDRIAADDSRIAHSRFPSLSSASLASEETRRFFAAGRDSSWKTRRGGLLYVFMRPLGDGQFVFFHPRGHLKRVCLTS